MGNRLKIVLCSLVITVVGLTLYPGNLVRAAAPGQVVINEIMYNPASDDQNEEFLELYNTTGNSINLSGWRFTTGISLTFQSGTSIPANGYLVVSPDILKTQDTYSITAAASYAPTNLSNSGETITLTDNLGVVIDLVAYGDSAPWPSSPDRSGPSLELVDHTNDNSLVGSWSGSLVDGGTPLAQNSVFDLDLPHIAQVSNPTEVNDGQAVTVNATVTGNAVSGVVVKYKVGFASEQTLTMYDDGAHNDSADTDSIYGVELPGQDGGSLVRFRIEATNGDGTTSVPSQDDTQNYKGYVVDDGTVSAIPVFRWYTADADFTDLTTNHLSDDEFVPAVVAIGDQVFDNSRVRVKGGSSVNFPKRKYKFELPAGYTINHPSLGDHIDEFSIQVYFMNLSEFPERLTTLALERFGFKPLLQQYVRVHKNGAGPSDFYGHYLFTETYDSTWREENGFDDGALYKEVTDKKTRLDENTDDIDDLLLTVQSLTGTELRDYLYDNLDIANIINYNAAMAVIRNDDWFNYHNQYQYRDSDGTGRWEYVPWDNDNSFMPIYFSGPFAYTRDPIIAPLPSNQSGPFFQYRIIERALFQFPEFQEMYYRRVATLYDDIYSTGLTKTWFQQLFDQSGSTLQDDMTLWGAQRQALFDSMIPPGALNYPEDLLPEISVDPDSIFESGTPQDIKTIFNYGEDQFKLRMDELREEGLLPATQDSSVDSVVFDSVDSTSGSIELRNTTDQAIDMSGWRIAELDYTVPQGSVLPAGQTATLVASDVAYRAANPGVFVLGEYSNSIPAQLTLLSEQEEEIDTFGGGNAAKETPLQISGGDSSPRFRAQTYASGEIVSTENFDKKNTIQTCVLNNCSEDQRSLERLSKNADEIPAARSDSVSSRFVIISLIVTGVLLGVIILRKQIRNDNISGKD